MRACLDRPAALAALLLTIALALAPGEPSFAFLAADRWTTTASGVAGFRGRPATLTWSLVPDGTPIPDRASSRLIALLDGAFGPGAGGDDFRLRPWFPLIDAAFTRWSTLGGVVFSYEPHDDAAPHQIAAGELGVRGDVRLAAAPGDGAGGVLASSQFPDTGDIVFDADDGPLLANPAGHHLRLRNALMHEIGHVLGLDHVTSSDARFLMTPSLALDFDGPQLDDVRGLHHLYGDRFERASGGLGNDELASAAPLGRVNPGDELVLGGDARATGPMGPDAADFLSLSGLGDADYFAFDAAAPVRVDVQLTPRGGRYRQGQPGENEILIDANASSDLALAVLTADGTELAVANAHPRGFAESVSDLQLPHAGAYVIRVTGSRDVVQLYELRLRIRSAAAPEPATISLLAPWLLGCAHRRRARSCSL